MDYKDYYATLDISADADEQAIKTAFRKLARVHHPDVAVEKIGATERFKEINEAYTVLSDPDKRRTYDLFRTRYERYQTTYRAPRPETSRPASASATNAKARTTGAASGATSARKASGTSPGANPAGKASGASPGATSAGAATGSTAGHTPYGTAAGAAPGAAPRATSGPTPGSTPDPTSAGPTGGSTSGTARSAKGDASGDRSGPRRTNTHTVSEEDFERLFRGFMWAYTATASRNSNRSGSTASSDFSDFFESLFGNRRNNAGSSPAADGETTEIRSGRDIEVTAQLSLGEAFHGTTRTLTYGDGRKVEVTIPPGVNTGSRLRVRGHGERLMGLPIGDLYMTVEVQPHAVFAREGDDLKIRVSVPYELAMKSGEVQIPTLDRPVQLKIPANAHTGQLLRLRGQGMPSVSNSGTRGDLIALIDVQAPPRPADATSANRKPAQATKQAKTKPPKSAAPDANRARGASRVRQVLGLALTTLSLLLLTAQALMFPSNGWLWVAGVSVVLLSYGLAGRSLWAVGVGFLAAGGCIWLLTQADIMAADALRQAWPLLPAALGVSLLSAAPTTNERQR